MQRNENMTAEDYLECGHAHYFERRFFMAILEYTKGIELGPNSNQAKYYYSRGLAHYGEGNFIEAIDDCTRAIELCQDNSSNQANYYYCGRGHAHNAQGNFIEAIDDCTRAIELCQDNSSNQANFYYRRGLVHKDQGNLVKAILDIISAIEIRPLDRYFIRAMKKFKKAEIFNAIQTLPKEEQVLLLGKCLDENTGLGEVFFTPNGILPCSLKTGTLKEISSYLAELKKSNMDDTNVAATIPSATAKQSTVATLGLFNKVGLIDPNTSGFATRMHNKL